MTRTKVFFFVVLNKISYMKAGVTHLFHNTIVQQFTDESLVFTCDIAYENQGNIYNIEYNNAHTML